jgi:hypothetical protein
MNTVKTVNKFPKAQNPMIRGCTTRIATPSERTKGPSTERKQTPLLANSRCVRTRSLQKKQCSGDSSTLAFPNGEPLHTPRARFCVRPGATACEVSFRSKPHPKRALVTCTACKQDPTYVIIGVEQLRKLPIRPRLWLDALMLHVWDRGSGLHDVAARVVGSDSAGVEARKGLAKSAFGAKDTGINTFPAWKLEHHFVELMSCREVWPHRSGLRERW